MRLRRIMNISGTKDSVSELSRDIRINTHKQEKENITKHERH